jgi:hypothetical protein
MYFDTKNYLKSTRNHTAKHAIIQLQWIFVIRCIVHSLKPGESLRFPWAFVMAH